MSDKQGAIKFLDYRVSKVEFYLNKTENFKNIVLVPFMVVAGDHAVNDMAGDDDDSWKSVMENVGRNVEVVLKGVGEYLPIREIYCEHIRRELWKKENFTV